MKVFSVVIVKVATVWFYLHNSMLASGKGVNYGEINSQTGALAPQHDTGFAVEQLSARQCNFSMFDLVILIEFHKSTNYFILQF